MTAHYDTLFNTSGAFDNASGCALLLALAEWISENPLRIPVELLFTGAEEFNLSGSRAFCASYKERGELSNVKAIINLDGVGRGDILEVWSGPEKFAITAWPLLKCNDLGLKRILKYPPPPGSDHTPFYNEGIPSLMLSLNDIPILHRPEDVIDDDKKHNLSSLFLLLQRFIPQLAAVL
jgi:Zn-dependent M28 family amino/carboxypeptidase